MNKIKNNKTTEGISVELEDLMKELKISDKKHPLTPLINFYAKHFVRDAGDKKYLEYNNLFKTYSNPFYSITSFKSFCREVSKKPKYISQRIKYGVAECDVWDLDSSCAIYMSNAIKMLATEESSMHSYPTEYETYEDWNAELQRLSDICKNYLTSEERAFDRVKDEGISYNEAFDDLNKEFDNGFESIKKSYRSLWD